MAARARTTPRATVTSCSARCCASRERARIPAGNPYQGADSARCNVTGTTDPGKRCQETFVWGLRNPFRIGFDPNAASTRFYINDVGQGAWEEIDLGQAGADYGWNVREGPCATGSTTNCGPPPAGMTNPIHWYGRSGGCGSITGAAFVPKGVWPSEYDTAYLYGDYVCGKIFRMSPSGGSFTSIDFGAAPSVVHLTFGPLRSDPGPLLRHVPKRRGDSSRSVRRDGEPLADRRGLREPERGECSADRQLRRAAQPGRGRGSAYL
ncbi:MAG: sorbosone dehydrogenase family protein [Gaiellaceae bacterium]